MTTSKKTILLTGATGNMGRATLQELMARTDRLQVRAFVLPNEREHAALRPYKGAAGFEIALGDLTRYDDVFRALHGVDQVLHIGGMVSPLADWHPELTMKVNVGGAENLVRGIKAHGGADRVRLIYIGTVAQTGHRASPVHWGRTGDPIKISAFDHYAVSKTRAEAIVADSGLRYWTSLRQTGIAHANIWKTFDPIMFHSPFNSVLEWVTVGDSGRLAANTCEDWVPEDFWGGFYNISGGEGMRVVNHEFASALSRAMGQSDWRVSYQPNWFATRNFHGQWYTDADRLEQLVPFRRESLEDYVEQVRRAAPLYVKLGARFAPGIGRSRIRRLAESKGGPLYWLAHNDEARINAFFGSRKRWERIPSDWSQVTLEQPSRVLGALDHGYDESRPIQALTAADLRQAAAFRGGTYEHDESGAAHEPAHWSCALGHRFTMSPRLLLKGGHWCPTCMVDASRYDDVARRSSYFAQVWRGEG